MTRDQAKRLLPIIQAVADGKTIQAACYGDKWVDIKRFLISELNVANYRVKPEPKYRPFKSAEECWQEMQKHQPFGWVKSKSGYELITCTMYDDLWLGDTLTTTERLFNDYTFTDGTPFGIKEEDKA